MRVIRSLVTSLLWLAAPAIAQQGGDLQAQILYAFQTEDGNELAGLVQTLGARVRAGDENAAVRYHLAHADYRLGLLAGEMRAHDAESALADCVDELKPVLEHDIKSVESLALQAACYEELAKYRKLQAGLLRSRALGRIAAAAELAPRNPRVMLLTATLGLARAKADSVEYRKAESQLEMAAQLFERSSATRDDVPGWGHAEAYLSLGLQFEARGDLVEARNWIEKSLIVAPDFKAAQRRLAALVGH